VGKIIGGCEILGVIGRGAMGSVYEAKQLSLERLVALKTIRRDYVADKGFLERFRREARAVGRFNTQHVVQIHDVGFDQGLHYIIMERVRGGNLRAYASSQPGGCLSVEDVLRFLSQSARGLQEAERLKIVHRDIKPGNLLVDDAGCVKITDFGIAKMLEGDQVTMTATDEVLGTPLYMSPEQIEGGPIDHRSDMYSLGATFYHLLTGSPPVEGESVYEVIKRKSVMTSISPRRLLQRAIPEGVSSIIERMTALRAADRYASFKDLLEDIERIEGGGEPAPAPPSLAVEFIAPPPRWPRVVAWAAAAVVLISLAALGVWQLGPHRDPDITKRQDPKSPQEPVVVVDKTPVEPKEPSSQSDPPPEKETKKDVSVKKAPLLPAIADLRRELDGLRAELKSGGPTSMLLERAKSLLDRIPPRSAGGTELEADVQALAGDIGEGQKRKDFLLGRPVETVDVSAPFDRLGAYWREVSAILTPEAGAGPELRSWLEAERLRRSAALETRVQPAVDSLVARAERDSKAVLQWEAAPERLEETAREIEASKARLAEVLPAGEKAWAARIDGALKGIASARESRARAQKRLSDLEVAAAAAAAIVDGVKSSGEWTPEVEKDVASKAESVAAGIESLRSDEPRAQLDGVKATLAKVDERRKLWTSQRSLVQEALAKLEARDSEGAAAALARLGPGAQADPLLAKISAGQQRLSAGFKDLLEDLDVDGAREEFQRAATELAGLGGAARYAEACAERAGRLVEAARGMARVAAGDVRVSEKDGRRRVGAFFIDRCETSIEDYQAFVTAMGTAKYEDVRALWPSEDLFRKQRQGPDCLRVPDADRRCPVEDVCYHEARAYVLWKGKDLPTIEEWWLAAKGQLVGEKHRFDLPNERVAGSVHRPVRVNDRGIARAFPPGDPVHHLAGNVAEWLKARDAAARESLLVGGRYMDANEKKFTGELPDRLPLSESRAGYGFRGVLRPADFFADLLPVRTPATGTGG
jgi:serine/threonine protein kinase/formylglycine-generating enzyme required for sulfatase activity